jgi:Sec-independent protein translocase protein TatA
VKEIGKLIGNIRKSERDFRNEITRELNLEELTGIGDEVARGVAGDVEGINHGGGGVSRARPYPRGSAAQPQQDARVRELEEEVRRLRMELEELRSRSVSGSGSGPMADPARTSGAQASSQEPRTANESGEGGDGSS